MALTGTTWTSSRCARASTGCTISVPSYMLLSPSSGPLGLQFLDLSNLNRPDPLEGLLKRAHSLGALAALRLRGDDLFEARRTQRHRRREVLVTEPGRLEHRPRLERIDLAPLFAHHGESSAVGHDVAMGLDVGTDRAPHALGVPDHEVGLLEDADDLRWAHERELALGPCHGHGIRHGLKVPPNHGLRRIALVGPGTVRAVAASAIHAIPADDAIRQLSEP